MLLKNKLIDGIKAGNVTLIFRRWKKSGVKVGGTQMTQLGVIGIDTVDVVALDDITDLDAREAGFATRDELIADLYDRDVNIYKIRVYFAGEDPRKSLRESAKLTEKELADIIAKLKKLDTGSKRGNWTLLYLQMIHDRPNIHAQILAESIGLDIPTFKPWVRKLKALGLTESLRPGYRLSPRGHKVLEALRQKHDR
ncbi:MAG: ASCH domain-containing protein [Acidobacteriota bacterium]